ncbi:hypothetical protein [Rhizobium sullae]|uniref:Membrane transporter protein n=1 Tax=Rhizobium sullae TaxID=50338 RepID=A0A4R3PW89_RHISU|nr:hypothetical protein [Rhizobium sullae]TCU12853.1 hypothetical protein EV132_11454 [Rhizobium sullae]
MRPRICLPVSSASAAADLLAGLFGIGGGAILAVVLIIPLTMYIAPIGARLAHRMSKRQLEIGFGIFLIVTGAVSHQHLRIKMLSLNSLFSADRMSKCNKGVI